MAVSPVVCPPSGVSCPRRCVPGVSPSGVSPSGVSPSGVSPSGVSTEAQRSQRCIVGSRHFSAASPFHFL